ncbi:putative fungal-specific transcription factor [Thelonectria olida]|uniref:Fungal-specific transcription factor n=1 Tax=Thelonectria olida TaxID=1576542 RepID=A0A9P8W395_9HYPO|nr:putative fungal-specific transcription factor [Thelonectria olida]
MASVLAADELPDGPEKPLRRQPLRISNACDGCRRRKVKCDGGRPECSRCQARRKACTYNRDSITVGQQPRRKAPVRQTPRPIRSSVPVQASPPTLRPSSLETPSTISPPSKPDQDQEGQDTDQNRPYYTAHGRFASRIAAAIDVRAGLAPGATSHLVPFVDAPLFGAIDLDSPRSASPTAVLPPRAYADRLVGIYWQYVHPVEPVLDRDAFFRDYETSYSSCGATLCNAWLSILNLVFALAVQRQESTPLQKRDEEGNRYFHRAWALLPPGEILWKPASLQLVQCVMLLNRYLHCTNNQQKTWMTAGLAMRMAQSMCIYISDSPSGKDSSSEAQLRQQVWASCIALDRCVSWSLGRTSTPSLMPLHNRTDLLSLSGSTNTHAGKLRMALELHEIGNHIQLAQTEARNTLSARLGLPRLYQQDDYHAVAVQLDACLNRWEDGLPSDYKLHNLSKVGNRATRAEGYLLHLRLLHYRIFLYRPMLARVYSMKSHKEATQEPANTLSLGDRLARECAGMCIEAAQKVTSLIIETLEPYEAMGLLPWWYRIYYLHIAGTNFLAAMFRSDLFTESASKSWQSVMSALHAHEHLSAYVERCIRTFETLSARILETQCPSADGNGHAPLEDETPGSFFDDMFQDAAFNFDNFLFSTEDINHG